MCMLSKFFYLLIYYPFSLITSFSKFFSILHKGIRKYISQNLLTILSRLEYAKEKPSREFGRQRWKEAIFYRSRGEVRAWQLPLRFENHSLCCFELHAICSSENLHNPQIFQQLCKTLTPQMIILHNWKAQSDFCFPVQILADLGP